MITTALTKEKARTNPFVFSGDCVICAKGDGIVRILRKINGAFEVVTNELGQALEYSGKGVILNHHISCKAKCEYVVEGITDSQINVSIVAEK